MSPDGPSNIRVFVHWHGQTVFAGEEVKCSITFRNVAPASGSASSSSNHLKPLPNQPRQPNSDRPRQLSPLQAQARTKAAGLAPPPASSSRGHRASLSLSVPSSSPRARSGSVPWSPPPSNHESRTRNGHAHKRSLSIVSISSSGTADDQPRINSGPGKPQRPTRGHARASSLQIVSRGPPINGPRSASQPQRQYNSQASPLYNATYPSDRNNLHSGPAATVPNTPMFNRGMSSPGSGSDILSEFRFPVNQSPVFDTKDIPPKSIDETLASPASTVVDQAVLPLRPRDTIPTINEQSVTPAARVLSTTSIAGTPRSSGEFYSLSNNSTETLASEYVTQQPLRAQGRPPHFRRGSNLSHQVQTTKYPEALMMGYAQVQGSFTLDGSLVNLGPFEQVKRKAVVGGQGGGVIGVETTKRDSGLLRGFGWGNITNSIGELLGGGELSSIKEMRGVASSKSIPLLSTPQSILFVDLQLAPGESRTFEYSFRIPRGLPPTHRGRALKISYNLVIGTQRPGGAKEQEVRSVDVPFRVLGSVNSHGEILGHDLMTPYILLRDQATVQSVDHRSSKGHERRKASRNAVHAAHASNMQEFLSYVDQLLNRPRQGSGAGGLLSPTAQPNSRRPSTYFEEAATAREAIDLAVLRSNATSDGQQSANRFEIARNGRRVGVVMLARPAYRLGEAITLAVDFSGAEVPCYAVHAALETSERVDASLALRSEASIHRVTRKVYVSASEATLYATRMVFNPTIPVSATPEFVTSGVSLEWKIRLEFVVPSQDGRDGEVDEDQNGEEADPDDHGDEAQGLGESRPLAAASRQHKSGPHPHPLLEEISRDDRGGLVLVAVENLPCESFEVAVPLRVYGAVCEGLERLDRDEGLDEGIVV